MRSMVEGARRTAPSVGFAVSSPRKRGSTASRPVVGSRLPASPDREDEQWMNRLLPPYEAHPEQADHAGAEAHRRNFEIAMEVRDGVGADDRDRLLLMFRKRALP